MKRLFSLVLFLLFIPCVSIAASEDIPHPSDFSGSTLRKVYEPYNYHLAKTSPTSYKNTSVYFPGTVLIYSIMDDGWGYALVLYEGEGDKPVYITLPPGCLGDSGIDFGDDIEVYGVSYGMTETGIAYPAILTTMQLVNHGDNGLFPDLFPSSTNSPDGIDNCTFARTKKGANLRSEPRADSDLVFSVKQGERLKILSPNYVDGWHQVEFRGKICYISAKLVDYK